MFKKNNVNLLTNRGFTLIELLIVIAIIGILAGVILVNMDAGRKKGQLGAFKNATRGSYTGLATLCVTTGAPIAVPADTAATDWDAAYTLPCSSNGKFIIRATLVGGGAACVATINENGVTYAGADCN